MIYTVTFNPALDYVLKVDNLDSKDINRSQGEQIYYGGKGINVSVILSRLGVSTKTFGFLAGFSGKYLEEMLTADNVENDFIYLENGYTRINVKIRSDKELDINAQGPTIEQSDTERLMEMLSSLGIGDVLVLAGSVPSSLSDDIYEKICAHIEGQGVELVVDTTGKLLMNVLKYKPFMIKPNHHELGELFGVEIFTLDDVKCYAGKLQEMGARNVLVSMGRKGAALLDENGELHTMGNVGGSIKSSVGCGDSMVAGFLAGYLEKRDYSYALRLGSACGNATAFSDSLATKKEIDDMLKKLK